MDGFPCSIFGHNLLPPVCYVLQGQRRSHCSKEQLEIWENASRTNHEKFLQKRQTDANARQGATLDERFGENIVSLCKFHQFLVTR